MLSMRSQFVFVLIIADMVWFPVGSRAQDPPVQEQTAGIAFPPRSIALAEVPLGRAVVTYENGELTIIAQNAALGDVLRAVCGLIGAELDSPSEPSEPILGILGPGPVREVLASLLKGSDFNYVMQASDADPKVLARVIIVPKTQDSDARRQIAQGQVSQSQVSSTPTASIGKATDVKQLTELLTEAKAELASSGGAPFDIQGQDGSGGDGDPADGAQRVDAAAFFQLVEAQIKAVAVAEANPPSLGGQAGAAASDATNSDPGANSSAPGRPRHRRRH
jgi:hypothetical protein